jgi:glycosyltransferase involved in cell wall biosynthesis
VNVLYITYDGLLEPLGQSQVLAYLRQLAKNHKITVVSYEKPIDWVDVNRRETIQKDVRAVGIHWCPLRYHKRLSIAATAWDIARGMALCRRLVQVRGIQIVHARSYVPSVIAVHLKRFYGVRYIFDMRGFWPDEKVDAGTWSSSSQVYHIAKRYERQFLSAADAIVTLTNAGMQSLAALGHNHCDDVHYAVIPTCADLDRFSPGDGSTDGSFTFGYVGNAGGWYRFGPVVAAFEAIRSRRPEARFLIVNQGQHELIRHHLGAKGVPKESVELVSLHHQDVPNAIRQMNATAFFVAPTFSKQASAPTKLAEFLGSGVPCLVNAGVGDMGHILQEDKVGVVVDCISDTEAAGATPQLVEMAHDPLVRARCVDTARRRFSLQTGLAAYDALYRKLATEEVT